MAGRVKTILDLVEQIAKRTSHLKMDAESRMERAAAMKARPTTDEDILSNDDVLWHGSPSGYLVGRGIHLGTPEAAQQALEARIGIPASGRGWTGDTPYKDTLLMGRDRVPYLRQTGYNSRDAAADDYLPTRMPTYGDRTSSMSGDELPSVRPYMIVGEMTNSPYRAMSDSKANATMSAQLRRGTAKRGYYYKNEGEDVGSISAVVPGIDHVVPINKEMLYTLPNGRLRSRFAAFDPARADSRDLLAGAVPLSMAAEPTLDDLRAYLSDGEEGYAGGGKVGALTRAVEALSKGAAKKRYPMADKGAWYGDANFDQTGGRLEQMSPDQFLSRSRPMTIDDLTRENIEDLKRHILEGGELDPLALYKGGKEDGRHRAHAAKELGLDEVPVLNWRGDDD